MAGMGFAEDFGNRVREAGLQIQRLSELSGVSRGGIYLVLAGKEPGERVQSKLLQALAQIAAVLSPPDRSHAPAHPGVAALAADAELVAALAATPEELAALGRLYVEWRGRPVVIADKLAACEALRLMRRLAE